MELEVWMPVCKTILIIHEWLKDQTLPKGFMKIVERYLCLFYASDCQNKAMFEWNVSSGIDTHLDLFCVISQSLTT